MKKSPAVNDRQSSNRRPKIEINSGDSDDSVQVSTRYYIKNCIYMTPITLINLHLVNILPRYTKYGKV